MAHKQDVLELLEDDHREAERMFAAYEAVADPVRRRELIEQLSTGLGRHAAAEEEHLHPVIRRVLPDGDRIVASRLRSHAAAARTMAALDGTDPDSAECGRRIGTLMEQIQEQTDEEENELFPALRSALSHRERLELGAGAERSLRAPSGRSRTHER